MTQEIAFVHVKRHLGYDTWHQLFKVLVLLKIFQKCIEIIAQCLHNQIQTEARSLLVIGYAEDVDC